MIYLNKNSDAILHKKMEETCFIKVFVSHGKGYYLSRISSEDYYKPDISEKKWRLSKSGYAVRAWKDGNKVHTEYLHKIIHGHSCYHINGDRLDNRRENLKSSESSRHVEELSLCNRIENTDESSSSFHLDKGTTCINYDNDKVYAGRVNNSKKPHGFGVLTMNSEKQLLGSWKDGNLKTGMIIKFDTAFIDSDMVAVLCPPHIQALEFVEEGLIVKTIHMS